MILSIYSGRNTGVTGKAVTPYVLQRVNELTGGKSLEASIRVFINGAAIPLKFSIHP